MYLGCNLNLINFNSEDFINDNYETGKSQYRKHKRIVKSKIESFKYADGSINAKEMKANWFPQIKPDIFISHSHADEKLTIALSGWLFNTFNLECFIDSCIWGYSDELLRIIDNEYCLQPNKSTYSYEKRNLSTSHVHMMLSTALSKMIDNAESIFFLNTPNSITPDNVISDSPQTYSPWIYSEIAMTQLIRKKNPQEHRRMIKSNQLFSESTIKVRYDLDLSHLHELGVDEMNNWVDQYNVNNGVHALDILYDMFI